MNDRNLYAGVDGADVKIYEREPFDTKWFSHRFNGPELRYEIAVSLTFDKILWASGPFECWKNPDIKISFRNLEEHIFDDEGVVADSGYRGTEKCLTPETVQTNLKLHSKARAQNETVNERLKNFSSLFHVFRHGLDKHKYVFFLFSTLLSYFSEVVTFFLKLTIN